MKTLITAADIAQMVKGTDKVLQVPPKSLVTPAARDAAKEQGIEIVECSALVQGSSKAAVPYGIMEQCMTSGVDTAFISKIVGEVLASLNISGAPRQLIKEADPSGLRLIRGDSIVLDEFPSGNAGDRVKLKEIFTTKDSPFLSAGLAALDDASCTCEIKQDEANYILEGVVTIRVQGREYVARGGDVLFIPAGTQVEYRAGQRAKWFFVAHPRKNRA